MKEKQASAEIVASKIDTLVSAISRDVVTGVYEPGTYLPSENGIARAYGVSRTVVRETIRRLTTIGLAETRRGLGTYVNPPAAWNLLDPLLLKTYIDSGHMPDISQELVELRTAVEIESARLAAARMTIRQKLALQQTLAHMEMTYEQDPERFAEADITFHEIIIEGAENRFLSQIVRYLKQPLIQARRLTSFTGGLTGRSEAQEWHRRLYAAIDEGDPNRASEAMRGHMEQLAELTNQALLLNSSSSARLPSGFAGLFGVKV
ncbi:MAG: FadR family transcriptional regulator [Caldilineaceae bacterium]|nr:FadR family transcriptional regulator [Caldilineaceae bacterium]